jgi:hypothetical protein
MMYLLVSGSVVAASPSFKGFKTNFEYSLKVNVDYSKRESFLKRTGEPPSNYEKLMKSINGTVEIADVVDTVQFASDKYSIRSIGTLNGVIGYALNQQRLIRDSIGTRTPQGYSSLVYQEVRGSTEPFQARVDPKKNLLNFTTNNTPTGQTPIQNRLFDPLVIAYAFVDQELPSKSLSANFTDGRSLRRYSLLRGESVEMTINGQKLKAVRFYKTTSKDDETSLQIWFSEKEHFPLKSIISLKDEYGITIQLDLKKIPSMSP